MISSIPQIDMSVQTPQPSERPQPQDVKQADGFGSMLRKVQKAKDQADQNNASGKTEDVGDSAGKTEKDGEKLSGSAASSAAPQEVPRQVPVPVHPDVPATQTAAQTPSPANQAQAESSAGVLPVKQISVRRNVPPADGAVKTAAQPPQTAAQAPAASAVLQTATGETVPADFGQTLPAAADAAFKMETVPPQAKNEAAGISETETVLPQAESEPAGIPQSADVRAAASASSSAPPQTAVSAKPAGTVDSTASVHLSANLAQDVPKIPAAEAAKPQTVRRRQQTQPGADAPPNAPPLSNVYSGGRVIVKISDAAAQTVPTAGSQLCSAVSDGLKAGKRQLQVDLYPQSLGKVSVSLASENGILTVEIEASNPKTQSLLVSSSGEISSMLHASTGQAVQVTAGQNAGQQAQQQFAGQNGGSAQQEAARQQQQQEEARKYRTAQWYAAGNSAGFSTKDFLTALQSAAV